MNIAQIAKMAQQMQSQMAQAQDELKEMTLEATAEGTGMSPVALVGSLVGSGSFTLENGRVMRLDPAAFDAVIRAVDQGLPIDATRIRDRVDAALTRGGLGVALAEGAITISDGQARLSNPTVRAQRADLVAGGSVSLSDGALDARITQTTDGTGAERQIGRDGIDTRTGPELGADAADMGHLGSAHTLDDRAAGHRVLRNCLLHLQHAGKTAC